MGLDRFSSQSSYLMSSRNSGHSTKARFRTLSFSVSCDVAYAIRLIEKEITNNVERPTRWTFLRAYIFSIYSFITSQLCSVRHSADLPTYVWFRIYFLLNFFFLLLVSPSFVFFFSFLAFLPNSNIGFMLPLLSRQPTHCRNWTP